MIVLAGVLAVVLTWLLLRSAEPTNAEYAAVQHALVQISTTETKLRSDLLSARSGAFRDDDPISADVVAMQESLTALREVAHGVAAEPIARIADGLRAQERAAAEMKAASGTVRTSLAQLSLLSGRIARAGNAAVLAAHVGAVTAALLHLSLDVDPGTIAEAASRLDDVARQPIPAELTEDTTALILNGRRLVDLLPRVDGIVRRVPEYLTLPLRNDVRAVFEQRRTCREVWAFRYRLALYGVAILFLASLVELGRRLRIRTIALRERADVEHTLARVSNTFISCAPNEIRGKILTTLARFGTSAQSNRAYLVLAGDEPDVLIWAAPGVAAVPNWPDALGEILPLLAAESGNIFSTLGYGERPPLPVEAVFARHGVHRWSCVKLLGQDEMLGILVFERAASRPPWLTDIANLVQLSGVTMSNALQRERSFHRWLAFQDEAQRAKRLETVGLFASGVAHNFNNMLGVMLGHAEVAAELSSMPAASAHHLRRITETGERARALVKSILAYGRREDGPCQPVPVGNLVQDTAALLRLSVDPPIRVKIDLPPEDIVVLADVTHLQQVFVNLIRNAAEASEAGTPVDVLIAAVTLTRRRKVSHGALEPGRYARVSVADQGVGIPDGSKAMLFKPFFTTRPAGTGLGLATAAEVVRDLGGAFDVETAPGQGTRFEVWLPAQAVGADGLTAPTGCGEAIMVVTGQAADLARAEDILAALSYEPVGFGSAASALAALSADPGRFDAILIGTEPSDMPGPDLARQIRARSRRIPLVELRSGSVAEAPLCLGSSRHFDDVLRWPLAAAEVAATMRRILKHREPSA